MKEQDQAEMKAGFLKLKAELDRDPFAPVIFFDGRYWPRDRARAIERSFWPIVFPNRGRR